MINLLPDDKKKEIRAGRANVILLNYVIMSIGAAVLVGLIVVGAYATQSISRANAQGRVAESDQAAAKYADTKKEADEFRSNLATAKQITDKQTYYSKLLLKIASVVPQGVVLDSLELNPANFGSEATLSAHAKTYEDALQLKSTFQKSTQLFSDVHFSSIQTGGGETSDTGGAADTAYPVSISLSVIINKDAVK